MRQGYSEKKAFVGVLTNETDKVDRYLYSIESKVLSRGIVLTDRTRE